MSHFVPLLKRTKILTASYLGWESRTRDSARNLGTVLYNTRGSVAEEKASDKREKWAQKRKPSTEPSEAEAEHRDARVTPIDSAGAAHITMTT